jgi:DNA-binding FrmR family transcriptional regulator
MRLRRIERQVRDARAVVENGHDFAAVLADVSAAQEALQALARNVGVARRTIEEPRGRTDTGRDGRPAVRPLSRCSRRGDA